MSDPGGLLLQILDESGDVEEQISQGDTLVEVVDPMASTLVELVADPGLEVQIFDSSTLIDVAPEGPPDLIEVHINELPPLLQVTGAAQGPPGVGIEGPEGPEGPAGPAGEGYYQVFNFAAPQDVWVCTHNQNTYGIAIETVDINGDPIDGTDVHTDRNTITTYFYYPQTGEARVFI